MNSLSQYIIEKLHINKDMKVVDNKLIDDMINIITANKKYQENKTPEIENDIYTIISDWISDNNIKSVYSYCLDFNHEKEYTWEDTLKKLKFNDDIINKLEYHSCYWGWNNRNIIKHIYLGKTKRNYYSFIVDNYGNKEHNLPRLTIAISYNYTEISIGFIKKE